MIKITKRNEPRELQQYRLQKFSSYSDMPKNVRKKVLESLIAEQGGLCAYCMCRISDGEENNVTIEHCEPQSVSPKKSLNYNNMVAVCNGNREDHSNENKTCDARRGCLPIKEQAFKFIDVFDEKTLEVIEYKSDGTIFSNNLDANEDLNYRLNLNCEARQLIENRRAALEKVQEDIYKTYTNKTIDEKHLKNRLTEILNNKEKIPFCGILIWWLKKKIRNKKH
ncbi:TIGR02646 family protein [bacterium]|nr:TIGR02646 family protein [bacterium]